MAQIFRLNAITFKAWSRFSSMSKWWLFFCIISSIITACWCKSLVLNVRISALSQSIFSTTHFFQCIQWYAALCYTSQLAQVCRKSCRRKFSIPACHNVLSKLFNGDCANAQKQRWGCFLGAVKIPAGRLPRLGFIRVIPSHLASQINSSPNLTSITLTGAMDCASEAAEIKKSAFSVSRSLRQSGNR